MTLVVSWVEPTGRLLAEAASALVAEAVPGVEAWVPVELPGAQRTTRGYRGRLAACEGAILCITPESRLSPWLFHEAGVLRASIPPAGVLVPLLLDLAPVDFAPTPLGLFQGISVVEPEVRALLRELGPPGTSPARDGEGSHTRAWEAFYDRVQRIPGHPPRSLGVTLLSSNGELSFRIDASDQDVPWERMDKLFESLSRGHFGAPRLDPKFAHLLDVTHARWLGRPKLLSRVRTRYLAVVEGALVERWGGDARIAAAQAREALPAKGSFPKFAWDANGVVIAMQGGIDASLRELVW